MFGSGILGSGLIQIKLRRVRIGSVLKRVGYGSGMGCPFSVHFGSGHYDSGMTWVGSFRVWVISGVAQFRVSFGYGSVYIGCSGPNRFSPFRVLVRVWIRVNRFGFWISGQFCQVYVNMKIDVFIFCFYAIS